MITANISQRGFATGRALLLFLPAYVLVTLLATATSVIYGMLIPTPPPAPGVSMLKAPVFLATVPFHVVIMLIVWPLFAGWYFRKRPLSPPESGRLGFIWLVAAMIVDYLAFVAVHHPYAFTPHEFYVDYQPWISLIYLSILISPWIWFGVSRAFSRGPV